jgi:hypothetical protein
VDETLGLIHSLTTTAANEHDITQTDQLLHGKEKRVWGDAGYCGIEKREAHTNRKVEWQIAMRPSRGAIYFLQLTDHCPARARVEGGVRDRWSPGGRSGWGHYYIYGTPRGTARGTAGVCPSSGVEQTFSRYASSLW